MTRKARHQADSTTARATSELQLQQLKGYINQMLSGLSEREAVLLRLRYGIDDGQLRTWVELGERFGVTRERIRQIELKAFQKLRDRHHDQAEVALQALLDTDFSGLPRHVQERALEHPIQPPWWERDVTPMFCDRHQTRHFLRFGDNLCGWCGCIAHRRDVERDRAITAAGGRLAGGRPRDYCSNACKQAAYRQRRRNSSP